MHEELSILTNPETYIVRPKEAWRRIKTRSNSPRFLATVRTLAEFRETYAQQRNIPRNRVYKDDALIELASSKPAGYEDLKRSRLLLREARKGEIAEGIIAAVQTAQNLSKEDLPSAPGEEEKLQVNPALADLLRVLLKSKTETMGVAAKLIAASSELDAIAAGKRNLPSLSGWRREAFGEDALRLCKGEIALIAKGKSVKTIPVPSGAL